jgi:hypothetical protein
MRRKVELLAAWLSRLGRVLYNKVYMHIKGEFYDSNKDPRGINSRSDQFKVVCGPWFSWVEKQVFKHKAFVKYIPVTERPAYIQNRLGHFKYIYSGDYSRFESAMVPRFMKAAECVVYKHFGLPQLIIDVITGTNTILAAHMVDGVKWGIRLLLTGGRMSGEMNTSLGNGLNNMLMIRHICRRHGIKFKCCVEGDDSIIGCNKALKASWFEAYGVTCKLNRVSHPGQAGFCSMRWSSDQDLSLMISVYRLLKLGWSHALCASAGDVVRDNRFGAIALSLAYEFPGCPIAWAIAKKYGKGGSVPWNEWKYWHYINLGLKVEVKGNVIRIAPNGLNITKPTPQARLAYEIEIGVPVAAQLDLERQIFHGALALSNPAFDELVAQLHPDLVRNKTLYCVGQRERPHGIQS